MAQRVTLATASTSASPTPLLLCANADAFEDETSNMTPMHQVLKMRDPSSSQSHPLLLSFSNLTYTIKMGSHSIKWLNILQRSSCFSAKNRETKVLLNDISGKVNEGEILAILGPSGSGKSTLLDALANRIVKGSLKGMITLNCEQLESKLVKVISAYVMQDDLLFPMLTVEETLMFAAELRLPRTLSKSRKKKRVQELLNQLDLENAAKTVIGDEGHRGVSGGERRRVSIGIDILHDPILLFLDEPTTGLDSTSAFTIVKILQRIAKTGSIVIMSIHQPSYRILGLLDRLMFLFHGEVVYSGSPSDLPSYLADLGRPVPEDENPSEAALDLICNLQEGFPEEVKSLVEFNRAWRNAKTSAPEVEPSPMHEAIISSISRGKLVPGATSSDANYTITKVQRFANPFWKEILVLSKRSLLNSRRMPEVFCSRFGAALVIGIISASVCWQLPDSPKGNTERTRILGFFIATVFFVCSDGLPVLLQERSIFLRENAYNAYRKISYCIADTLVWLPSHLFLSITFSAITFWGTGLDGGLTGFLFFFAIIFASLWAGNSFVTLVTEVVPDVLLGYVIIVAVFSYFILSGGLYHSPNGIPNYWIWFHYMSFEKYPYAALLQNEYGDPTKCFTKAIQAFDNTPLASAPAALKEKLLNVIGETLGKNITSSTCVATGPDILNERGGNSFSKWECFWITIAWGFFFRILFYFALLIGGKNKRK